MVPSVSACNCRAEKGFKCSTEILSSGIDMILISGAREVPNVVKNKQLCLAF